MVSSADQLQIKELLQSWLNKQVQPENLNWFNDKLQQLGDEHSDRFLFTTFSSIPRYAGKADLQLTEIDLAAAQTLRPGWEPRQWSIDQVGRSLVLLSISADDGKEYQTQIEKLFGAADVNEQIALYQSLPLLPHPHLFISRAAEGLRTSMDAVFNAIALNNPFPGDYFETLTWNQMILKAVFVGSPLHAIQQLDKRANAELARMLSDYAHERWAAQREVTPELWRLIGPFLNDHLLGDLQRALDTSNQAQQLSAALACFQSSLPSAQALLSKYPNVRDQIQSEQLDWPQLMKQCA